MLNKIWKVPDRFCLKTLMNISDYWNIKSCFNSLENLNFGELSNNELFKSRMKYL